MRYIDQWLSGLGLDHIIPLLQEHGITTPNKLAALSLRDMYEVVGVNDAEDRKKLHFLIQRLQNILKKTPESNEAKGEENGKESTTPPVSPAREEHVDAGEHARKVYVSPVRHRPDLPPPHEQQHHQFNDAHSHATDQEGGSSDDENDLRVLRRQPRHIRSPHQIHSSEITQHNQTRIHTHTHHHGDQDREVHNDVIVNRDLMRAHSPIDVTSSSNPPSPSQQQKHQQHQQQPHTKHPPAAPSGRTHSPPRQNSPPRNRRFPEKEATHALTAGERRRPVVEGSASSVANISLDEGELEADETFRRIQQQQQMMLKKRTESYISSAATIQQQAVAKRAVASLHSHRRDLSPPPSPPPTPPPSLDSDSRDRGRLLGGDDRGKYDGAGRDGISGKMRYNPVSYVRHPGSQASGPQASLPVEPPGHTQVRTSSKWQPIIEYNNGDDDMAIRVVVRKRPLSGSESGKGDRDVLEIRSAGQVLVHEPKTKVDLTKVVETQEFFFDDAFEDSSSNEQIYGRVIWPLVRTAMQGGKASCFAYGQTGSGKTFTMMGSNPTNPTQVKSNAGLYVLAARDMFRLLESTNTADNRTPKQVMVSCFEIYGGKLFDLLNDRGVVRCLEDAKQQVQLPGLTEHHVGSVDELLDMMSRAHDQRSTGSTGANEESSRSHQVLQLSLQIPTRNKRAPLKRVGQLTFIDLAGSERGADTTHNSKQTRMEGAEINTSLLALKEVIRSLERKHGHTPFRGSKLTQVLKDSFVGDNTRTCMVACVSPSMANCEHTLNTLRYADRVKEHQQSRTKDDSALVADRPSTAAGVAPMYDKAARSASAQPIRPSTAQAYGMAAGRGQPLQARRGSDAGRNALGGPSGGGRGNPTPASVASPSRAVSIGIPGKRDWSRPDGSNMRDGIIKTRQAFQQSPPEKPAYIGSPVRGGQKQVVVPSAAAVPAAPATIEPVVKSGFRLHRGGNNSIPTFSAKPTGSTRQSLSRDSNEMRRGLSLISSPGSARKRQSSEGSDSFMGSNGSNMSAPPPPPDGLPDSNGEFRSHSPNRLSVASVMGHKSSPLSFQRVDAEPVQGSGRRSHGMCSEHGSDIGADGEDLRRSSYEDFVDGNSETTPDKSDEPSDDQILFNYEDNNRLGGTVLIQRTVELVSAHKLTISEMVEFMKEEMELVQNMEQSEPRDTHQYITKLENILSSKSESIDALQEVLQGFRSFREQEVV